MQSNNQHTALSPEQMIILINNYNTAMAQKNVQLALTYYNHLAISDAVTRETGDKMVSFLLVEGHVQTAIELVRRANKGNAAMINSNLAKGRKVVQWNSPYSYGGAVIITEDPTPSASQPCPPNPAM